MNNSHYSSLHSDSRYTFLRHKDNVSQSRDKHHQKLCKMLGFTQVTVRLLKHYLDALCKKDNTEAEGSRETFYQEAFLLAERV